MTNRHTGQPPDEHFSSSRAQDGESVPHEMTRTADVADDQGAGAHRGRRSFGGDREQDELGSSMHDALDVEDR